jgi:hypothetical protein
MSDSDPPSIRGDGLSNPLIRDELDRELATLAGPGAINCGFATERGSAEQVYRCATAALAAQQPFYCMYKQSNPGLYPVGSGSYPPAPPSLPWPVGYVGRADGVVFQVRENSRGTLVRGTDVLAPGTTTSPRRFGFGMTIPVLVSSPTAALDGAATSINGIVIVEAAIGIDGSVTDAHVLKPLPCGISDIADQLVRQCSFQPSRLFGVPLPVFYNIIVESRTGRLSVRQPAA